MNARILAPLLFALSTACAGTPSPQGGPTSGSKPDRGRGGGGRASIQLAEANDNRVAAGSLRGGVLTIAIDARLAGWKPDLGVDSMATVQVFSERGKTPTVPGPLIRIPLGTAIKVSLRNLLSDSTLIVHGLREGGPVNDTIQIASGGERAVTFKPAAAGTYLYWGSTSHSTIGNRWGRETQLNGAIVVDPPGATGKNDDRVLVMSLIDVYPDSVRNPRKEDIWELAINGRAWPHTERLQHRVGDTVRWRIINATDRAHPMHLHGFHFRTLAKGDWTRDTTYRADAVPHAVTEFMRPGSTARLEWIPTRAGNWLVHCHMTPHITPYPERPDTIRRHDTHDLMRHAEQAMAGLVMGIVVTDPAASLAPPGARHRERIFAQQNAPDSAAKIARGFVRQRGAEPRRDSVEAPGAPLILYRGERTAITVVNRMPHATTIHWHGMELESVFDGVSGWSGKGSARAPLLMPGDSFAVAFTPPRAGTYIYHTHMDEEDQLARGMYAPMLVLEPGEVYDPARDMIFMFGGAVVEGKKEPAALNGMVKPKPLVLEVGKRYRFRFINIHNVVPVQFRLLTDTVPAAWRALSKDGATLPRALSVDVPASITMGVGETYDFEWTPRKSGNLRLEARNAGPESFRIEQQIAVREAQQTSKPH